MAPSQETEIALMRQEISVLRTEIDGLEGEVKELQKQDKARMRAGLIALCGIVMSLGVYIWQTTVGKP